MSNSNAYVWGLMSRFAPQGLYLITTMVLARFLAPSDFGTMGVLAVIFTVANILLDSGLGGSLIQKEDINDDDCSTISSFNIIVSAIIYCSLFISASRIETFFEISDLSGVVKTVSLVFPITAVGIVPLSILKRQLKFREIFISTLSGVVIASFFAIVIAIKGGGVYALVYYQIIVNAVMVLLNFHFSKYKLSLRFKMENFKILIPFGFFTSVVTIIDTIYENLITTLTGKYLDVQRAGFLYQAKRIEETMSNSLSVAVGSVAFPILSRLRDNKEAFIEETLKTFKVITLLVFPVLTTVLVFSTDILRILFGEQWVPASEYLKVLMICGYFLLMEQLFLSFIKSSSKVKKLMHITIIKRIIGISLLFLSLIFLKDYLIYAYLLSTIIGCLMNLSLYHSVSGVKYKSIFLQMANCMTPVIIINLLFAFLCQSELKTLLLLFVYMVVLLLYYTVYVRYQGVNLILFIKNVLTKRK